MSLLYGLDCAECEENTWYYLKKGWGKFRQHNCFGQAPLCRECAMHVQCHKCSCYMAVEQLSDNEEDELTATEYYTQTLVDAVIAPLLYEDDIVDEYQMEDAFLEEEVEPWHPNQFFLNEMYEWNMYQAIERYTPILPFIYPSHTHSVWGTSFVRPWDEQDEEDIRIRQAFAATQINKITINHTELLATQVALSILN